MHLFACGLPESTSEMASHPTFDGLEISFHD
jgi:hypothetical protein